MEEFRVPVQIGPHREMFLAIKRGEISFEEVEKFRVDLHTKFEAAAKQTKLPDAPIKPQPMNC